MRYRVFASRNLKELLRDPLSYIFSFAFPILMLLLMTMINSGIPDKAKLRIFNINYLAPGIVVFGFAFIMLFTAIQVSKDRATSFLTRLYASPMKAFDFIMGYTLPLFVIAIVQSIITFTAAVIIGKFTGVTFSAVNILISIVTLIPSIFLFIGFGLLFGSLFNDKSAPPMSSLIITLSAIMGGAWMDIDMIGGVLKKVCEVFPFYYAVNAARAAVLGNYSKVFIPFIIVCIYAVLIYAISVLIFKGKMQSEVK